MDFTITRSRSLQRSLIGLAALLAGPFAIPARATLIVVDSSLGTSDMGSCTLTNAFVAASSGLPSGTCPAGDGNDVIELAADSAISLTGYSMPYGDSVLRPVQRTLLVVGNGSTISSEHLTCGDELLGHRLMSVLPGATLYLNGLTLTNGCALDSYGGGAIMALGSLDLENVTLSGNVSTWGGGAIAASGYFLQVSNSTFSDNVGTQDGGAVDARASETFISNSSFSQNRANYGGAISASLGARVVNSTFLNNQASFGGAISAGKASVSFATFLGNVATNAGAALYADGGTDEPVIVNSIIARAPGGQPGEYNCAAAFGSSLAFELTNFSDDGSCGNSIVVPSQSAFAFGTAGAYGGTTLALPLAAGSVAIGAAVNCARADGSPVLTDQRGAARNPGGPCDAGAFEHDGGVYPPSVLAPLGAGNLLISHDSSVSEFARTGTHVRDFWPPLLPPLPGTLTSVEAVGLLGFGAFSSGYNGNALDIYNLPPDLWTKTPYPAWIYNAGPARHRLVHAADRWFVVAGSSEIATGVLVVENGLEVATLISSTAVSDLKLGLDGLIYVLIDASVHVFDPTTLQSLGTKDLTSAAAGNVFVAIAVDDDGTMFLFRSDGLVVKLDPGGNAIGSTNCVLPGNSVSCDHVDAFALSADHRLFLISAPSVVAPHPAILTSIDRTFSAASSVPIPFPEWDGNSHLDISPVLPDVVFGNGFDS